MLKMLWLAAGARALRCPRRAAPLRSLVARRAQYDVAAVEAKWQRHWDEEKTFAATRTAGREKKYVLDMFPSAAAS